MRSISLSTAYNLAVFMTDSSDHVTGKTGLTLTITASKDGGAFASISPTVTELASGWYKLALTSSHTDTLGDLALHITGTGADPTDLAAQITDLPAAIGARTVAGVTYDNMLHAAAALAASKTSGMVAGSASTGTIRKLDDTGNLLVATLDSNGNRTAVTFTP